MEGRQGFLAISCFEQEPLLLQINEQPVEDDAEPSLLRSLESLLKKQTRRYFGVNSLKKPESYLMQKLRTS
jgi:hypothetical protein